MDYFENWLSLFNGIASATTTVVWLLKTVAETRRSRRGNGETNRKKF